MTDPTAVAFDPTSAEQREDPFTVLAHARREQPVFYAPELRLWVVTRHDDVLALLKDHRTFSSVGALTSATAERPSQVTDILAGGHPEMPYIIEVDPPLHDRIRGLVARAFTPRRIEALEPRIEEIAGDLIDGFAARGSADIVEAFAWPLPLRVLGELFGFPEADLVRIHHWAPTGSCCSRIVPPQSWPVTRAASSSFSATASPPSRRGSAGRPTTCSGLSSPRTTRRTSRSASSRSPVCRST